jgi:hypothetical protein
MRLALDVVLSHPCPRTGPPYPRTDEEGNLRVAVGDIISVYVYMPLMKDTSPQRDLLRLPATPDDLLSDSYYDGLGLLGIGREKSLHLMLVAVTPTGDVPFLEALP